MDPYLGEIRLFASNFCPSNWHICDGSKLPVSAYEALFSLIGTTYGGDGRTTFGLPDLRGRVPIGQGPGPNLTPRVVGQSGGSSQVTLVEANMPPHTHTFSVVGSAATTVTISQGAALAQPSGNVAHYVPPSASPAPVPLAMSPSAISVAPGGSYPHDNVMPYVAIHYIICVEGLYPQRP